MSGGAHLISCTVSPAICATHLIKIESAGVPNSTPSLHSSRLTLLLTGRSPALCAWRAPHSRSTSLHTAAPLKSFLIILISASLKYNLYKQTSVVYPTWRLQHQWCIAVRRVPCGC